MAAPRFKENVIIGKFTPAASISHPSSWGPYERQRLQENTVQYEGANPFAAPCCMLRWVESPTTFAVLSVAAK